MKANRKFMNGEDEAVSPVIAVILMVAITVVLAATVYVWVSGFGASSNQPAKTLSLSSSSALSSTDKSYTVASGTPGMKWGDLSFTIDGAAKSMDTVDTCATTPDASASTAYLACDGTTIQDADDTVDAGDQIYLTGVSSGQTLRILDSQANSVILTLVIG